MQRLLPSGLPVVEGVLLSYDSRRAEYHLEKRAPNGKYYHAVIPGQFIHKFIKHVESKKNV